MPRAEPLFGHVPWRERAPKLDDAGPRIAWLQRRYRDDARTAAIRIHYGLEDRAHFDAEVSVPAVCLAVAFGWPAPLAVLAMDAERTRAAAAAVEHEHALRRAAIPLIRDQRPGQVIVAALQRAADAHGGGLSTDELIGIARRWVRRRA